MELIRGEKKKDLFLEQKKILMKTLRRRLKQRKYQVYKRIKQGHINGLIAAAIGALSMLMSEPTAKKLCKEDMYVRPLNRDIYITFT